MYKPLLKPVCSSLKFYRWLLFARINWEFVVILK